ncbi:MAG: PD-(D/E)XK nuclease family protein [Candidatus Aenigmarchaeota archaeon]|nr:PD-(D/E)XK nuclease family protein [Candidatus Aenigmarchaeota archaeon]
MLVEKIDEFYREREPDKKRDYFYVSEVGDCPRKIFFKIKNAPKEPMEPRVNRIFHNGDHVHIRLMSVLYSLGLVTASEIEIPPDKLFHGRADAIVHINKENYVLEIKSMNPFIFEKRAMSKPDINHIMQLQLYMHYFNISKGIILVESKGNQELKEFIIQKDEKMIDDILSKFTELKEKIDNNELPPVPDKTGWDFDKCLYCVYRKTCRKAR